MTLGGSADRAQQRSRSLVERLFTDYRGPRLVLAVVVLMELARAQVVSTPYLLPALLLVMVWASFSFGLRQGQLSAVIVLVGLAWFFSRPPFINDPAYTFRLWLLMAFAALAAYCLQLLLSRIDGATAELERRAVESDRASTLTRMGSRLRLQEDMVQLRERALRHGHRYTVALCDLDRFTAFNRTQGFRAGDEVIVRVASELSELVRATDTVYRYGGEAFVVVMPEQGRESATQALTRLRRAVQALAIPHPDNKPSGVVTMSVGAAFLEPGEARGSDAVLEAAYDALERAKTGGRNRVTTEADAVGESSEEPESLETTAADEPEDADDATGSGQIQAAA